MPRRCLALALTVAALVACDRGGVASRVTSASLLRVALDTSAGPGRASVVLIGLGSDELARLEARGASDRDSVLWIMVAGQAARVAGATFVTDSALEFRPAFPFDRGRAYAVFVDPRALGRVRDTAFVARVALPAGDSTPTTSVVRILPGGAVFPENLLRLYVEFSAPMSRQGGFEHVRLLDDSGREVEAAFLPLEADFWNAERTRYTLFLDPGRVKRGILPNEQMGRAIVNGRTYTMVVDSTWRDGDGIRLVSSYRREFGVGPADEKPVAMANWRLTAPRPRSREPLVLRFDEPLDHGLMQRALGVETTRGRSVEGEITIGAAELEWRFTPVEPWRAGDYRVVVLSILEDPSGNRIGRAFEVDMFERVDSGAAPPERHVLQFSVR